MTRTLFSGGPIHTMAPGRPTVESLLVEDERIIAAGPLEAVAGRADDAQRIDLAGASLLPAFIDAHHHFCIAALDRRAVDLHHPAGSRIVDLLERVSAWLDADAGSGWARAQGWDPAKLVDGARPPAQSSMRSVAIAPCYSPLTPSTTGWSTAARSRRLAGTELPRIRQGADSAGPPRRSRRTPRRGRVLQSRGGLPRRHAGERRGCLDRGSRSARQRPARGRHHTRRRRAVPPAMDRLYHRAAAADRLPLIVHRMPIGPGSFLEPRRRRSDRVFGTRGVRRDGRWRRSTQCRWSSGGRNARPGHTWPTRASHDGGCRELGRKPRHQQGNPLVVGVDEARSPLDPGAPSSAAGVGRSPGASPSTLFSSPRESSGCRS